jgi:hypothetical protein
MYMFMLIIFTPLTLCRASGRSSSPVAADDNDEGTRAKRASHELFIFHHRF